MITARSSTPSCGSCGPWRRGGICPTGTGRGRPPTNHRLQLCPGPPAFGWGPEKGGCSAAVEALAVEGEHLGRSRGGLTSKIHLAVDGCGLPTSCLLGPGQGGDNPQLLPLLDQVAVGRDGPGRPRKRPVRVLADKAYSNPSTRAALRARRIAFTCPERRDQIAHRKTKGSHGGRPPAFDQQKYAGRNVVERCFNRLKQFRDLATRYAKRSAYYRSEITIAAIVLWLREDPRDTPWTHVERRSSDSR